MTDTLNVKGLVERIITRAVERLRALHPYAGRPAWEKVIEEEMATALEQLQAEVERRDELLRRWLAMADTDHWRDFANLSVRLHPVADDTRALLQPKEQQS